MAIYDGFIDRYMEDEMGDNDFEDKKSLMHALQPEEAKESQIPMQNAGLMQGAPQAPQAPPQVMPQQQRQQTKLQQPQQQGGGLQSPYGYEPSIMDNIMYNASGLKRRQTQREEAWEQQAMQGHMANDPQMKDYPAMMKSGSKTLQKYAMSKMNPASSQTSDMKNWEYGASRPEFRKSQASANDNYNSDLAKVDRYAAMDEPQRKLYREALRQPKMYDQGTQFQDPLSGKTLPIYNTQTQMDKESGKAFGKYSTNYLTDYGKSREAEDTFIDNLSSTKKLIGEAISGTDNWSAGWGSLLSNIPTTSAMDLKTQTETIKARLGIDKLTEMKSASDSGASGMGALSQKELDVVTGYLQTIEQASDPAVVRKQFTQLTKELDRIEKQYDKRRSAGDMKFNRMLKGAPEQLRYNYSPYTKKGGRGVSRAENDDIDRQTGQNADPRKYGVSKEGLAEVMALGKSKGWSEDKVNRFLENKYGNK